MRKLLIITLLIFGCDFLKEEDCAGIVGGNAIKDNCNVCDDNPENDCILDKCGVWGGEGYNEFGCCGESLPDPSGICDGYLDNTSYFPNEIAQLYIHSIIADNLVEIKITSIDSLEVGTIDAKLFPQIITNSEPYKNGFGYDISAEFTIPVLPSGLYLIANKIPFIVKTNNQVDAIILYPSNTINAYNYAGGANYYSYYDVTAQILSFQRPIMQHDKFSYSIPFFKWVKSLDFNFSYIADIDLDDYNSIANSKLIIIPGHSEYWSRDARINFDRFVDNGNDAIILSGDTMWWQIRYNQDGTQLICYKLEPDPIENPLLKTINWHESELDYPIISSIGVDFRFGGYGLRDDVGWDGYKIVNPTSPLFSGLDLYENQIISIPTIEYDGTPINDLLSDGTPIIDKDLLNYYKLELLGFDIGSHYLTGENTYGTFIVFQKTESSGIIINTATSDWCNRGFIGSDSNLLKQITFNMIDILQKEETVFSE